ncbi:di-trans,poly-cis-decaprenylcistransferase [Campylobacter sputorum subsp. bubulus]|uniref:Isoprenyl transferase n=1 Tax=Campylobacter sputorum subsp. sputorum TaxID=32024 RepID=A0A381DH56_9BACT|nr:polyprenyl diphosphate synthase [Campylobacter sputorum]ASM35009.1 undecaprenyl diphosphate synthetase [Campylobacter sputorum aubsp. sputorum RM3237]KAB0581861.1 di-trans,poly-cis-decaprenylcistransferase [Campylobacter sputorum subsp. sputorum]QEL05200.1 undecaprenyl diphosphate synthetase [Campylobacter sputorum subsp. sputorum]SUX09622.1 di-trans,poly-cis-decaprenylcistransferase [Campylobacter sputorum subsp. sputorum]SUX30729.1 di-trans,poly-cis-decaprenylcistransferase [Campylobacter
MNTLKHLAIIMDGNGRWAKERSLMRINGHEKGAEVVDDIAMYCAKNGIQTLSLYAFSTENWKRPKNEVDFLMKLLKKFIIKQREKLIKNDIKFDTIGDISVFDSDLLNEILNLKELTKEGASLNLVLALNYGGRDEIVRACKKLVLANDEINEENISKTIDSASYGDVDLLIRTGGEIRLSNFMLWEASYAELEFTDTFWPDFNSKELDIMVKKFEKKHRRFGGL